MNSDPSKALQVQSGATINQQWKVLGELRQSAAMLETSQQHAYVKPFRPIMLLGLFLELDTRYQSYIANRSSEE
jgi:hypothetical protein